MILLRIFVILLLGTWAVALNIMDFVDLYEGAERIFPYVKGGKYNRWGYLGYSAVFMSISLLPATVMCIYPSCKEWQSLVVWVDVVYIIIYIVLYWVIKKKRDKENQN